MKKSAEVVTLIKLISIYTLDPLQRLLLQQLNAVLLLNKTKEREVQETRRS